MIRWRLSLGLAALMALLIAVGVAAIWRFEALGSAVNPVIDDYRNIQAAEGIRGAVARLNGAYLSPGGSAPLSTDKTLLYDTRSQVGDALKVLEGAPGSPLALDPADPIRHLDAQLRAYFELYERFLQAGPRGEEGRLLARRIQDATPYLAELIGQIQARNEQAIFGVEREARLKSAHAIHFMLAAMALALAVFLYASYRLSKSLLEPIGTLTDFATRIGAGDLDTVVPVLSRDEIGRLAASFNVMAARLRAYRQSTTERIHHLNHLLEVTLASFPDPIFVLDKNRRIEFRNPAALRLAEALGLGEGMVPDVEMKIGEVIETGLDYRPSTFSDAFYYRIAEQEKSFLPNVLVIRNRDRTLYGIAVVLQDITRFRLLDDVKTNLVSTVSHELRTPLTSIRMVLHILLEKKVGALTPKQAELLVVGREDSERLLRTLNNLLDLSRIEDASHELHCDPTDPKEILAEVVGETVEAVRSQNMKIETEIDDFLPVLPMDRIRMKHVFTNFIDNAVKHSPAGATITLKARSLDGNVLRFSVIDEGEGIPAEFQPRVFDKFFRVPGQPKTGSGLGLSIARQIVVAHHGRIGVLSQEGKGSEFYCDLPVNGKN